MPILFDCENCQKKLKVPDSAAGKRGRCNECGHLNTIPAVVTAEAIAVDEPANEAAASTSPAASTPSGGETYNVKSAVNGAVFGPANSSTLTEWLNEGRITPNCQLQKTGSETWTMASQMFPSLGASTDAATSGSADDPFAQFQQSPTVPSQPSELNPYAPNLTPHTALGPEVRREIVPTSGDIGFCI